MEIVFNCPTCKKSSYAPFQNVPQFPILGYETAVQFSTQQDHIPSENEHGWWHRRETLPIISDLIIVQVKHPFRTVDTDSFWTLFTPPLSGQNGWEEHPAEIDQSGFVKCKIQKILALSDDAGWLQIKVEEAIAFSTVMNALPWAAEKSSFLDHLLNIEGGRLEHLGDWLYYSANAESDLGHWALMKRVETHIHLITFGVWGFHQDSAYLGNVRLSNQTYQEILDRCKHI